MHRLPPPCPRRRNENAALLSVKEAFLHEPPEPGEQPIAVIAVFMCECGHVFTEVQRPPTKTTDPPQRKEG